MLCFFELLQWAGQRLYFPFTSILIKISGVFILNEQYLKDALKVISDRAILINLAARRAKELAHGAHPLVNVDRSQRTQYLDIALREIADEKLSYEMIED